MPTEPTRLLAADEWPLLREIRLTALRESPEAFLSTYEEEAGWTDAHWAEETARGDWLVAEAGGQPVGLLGATTEYDIAPTDRYLSYMWVEGGQRRHGLGVRLVTTMLGLLRARGVGRAWLWVLDGNDGARRLYERLGFVSTGERQPLKKDPSRCEERMSLLLG